MIELSTLSNSSRPKGRRKRVGRGPGSGLGKTCGRGEKGAGSRSGYKRRYTYEGGQFRTFMKIPQRGFSNAQFRRELDVVNLGQIDRLYADGEHVDIESLRERGFLKGPSHGLKILGHGELAKKVSICATAYSDSAKRRLNEGKLECKILARNGTISAIVEE